MKTKERKELSPQEKQDSEQANEDSPKGENGGRFEKDEEETLNEEITILNKVQTGRMADDLKLGEQFGRYWKLRRGNLAVEIMVYGIDDVHKDKSGFMGDVLRSLFADYECHLSNAYLTDGTPDVEAFGESGRKENL